MRLIAIAAAAALLGACTPQHHHAEPRPAPAGANVGQYLGGGSEAGPVRISGEWIEASDAAAKASISFADGAASGSTGCNRWTASVHAGEGDALRFGVGGVTEMACPGPAMETERRFLDALQATRSAEEEGGMLTLKGASGEELMRFVRPAGTLEGVSWRRVDDSDANPHGGTLTFEGARASGHAGCNRWFAAVTREGARLRFGEAGLTRMMCAEPAMAAERNFIAALSATRGYRIEGEDLILTNDAGAVIARFTRER